MSPELPPTVLAEDASSPEAPLTLLVISPDAMRTYPLPESGDLTIGRAPECDISIDDPQISRTHAMLHIGPQIQVEDLGSANRTRIRGEMLSPGVLRLFSAGEVMDLGSSMLVLQRVSAPAQRRLASHGEFEARLRDECDRQKRNRRAPFAVVRFRVEGQVARSELETTLPQALRAQDVIAAVARGEYEMLLVESVRSKAESVVRSIREQLGALGARVIAGVALHPDDGLTADALLSRASELLLPPSNAPSVVVEDPSMRELYRIVDRVARGSIALLLLGETGVGKEIVAEAIHARSPRSARPFVRLNCAALSETLIESELFGYEKGAFTGADAAKPGLVESADGGTVFLDEVGELPLATQAKLLRVLEQREVQRVGSLKPRKVDVRFVSATNRNLAEEVKAGRFREDLLYRLDGATLVIPPLRERRSEIAPLARMFAARAASALSESVELSAEAIERLESYSWPGNIRELRNVMDRAVLLGGELILPEHLPLDKLLATWSAAPPSVEKPTSAGSMRNRIIEALEASAHNQKRAAERLGVSRQTLSAWLDRYDIPRPRRRD
ncbi:MAG: sigma 54-interacting transcriptional regulator [Deltaproteobacteria bacterium]|nr:sigma 54-interacting transcriptional regulator [Deltaproteobacteria bacterium]